MMTAREAARSLQRYWGRARERLRYLRHMHQARGHDRNHPWGIREHPS